MEKRSYETEEVKNLLTNKDFVTKLMAPDQTLEDWKNLFGENGVNLTETQLTDFANDLYEVQKLGDSSLENVGGGINGWDYMNNHPFVSAFIAISAMNAVVALPYGVAKIVSACKNKKSTAKEVKQ